MFHEKRERDDGREQEQENSWHGRQGGGEGQDGPEAGRSRCGPGGREDGGTAPGQAEPEAGEDNNRELAFLKGRHDALADKIGALGIAFPDGMDAYDKAVHLIVNYRDQFEALGQALLAREGFAPQADEGAVQSAIRVLGELDDGLKLLAGKAETATARDGRIDAVLASRAFDREDGESSADAVLRLVAALDEAVVAAREEDPSEPGDDRKAHKAALRNEVALFADLPDTAAITLRFGDGEAIIGSIPPREVARHELLPAGARMVFDARLDFDPSMPPARVRDAWLIAGKKTLRCEIPGGLPVGGGAQAQIPAGFLEFGERADA